MSHKLAFFGVKKVVQVVQIEGRGGGAVGRGNLDKIQKNSYFSSGDHPLGVQNWAAILISLVMGLSVCPC